jgi:hypothetical protein
MEKTKNYNVFIGWSGEQSRVVATFLRTWIAQVVQSARPWMSDTDIPKGSGWLDEVLKVLADVKVGITCLTSENLQRPWILFEAGAISKAIGERTRVCTLLIGEIKPQDVAPPLGMFQATKAQKDDILKLVRTINEAVSEEPVPEKDLDVVFGAMWPNFEEMLKTLPASEGTAPVKRSVDDMVSEILEIVRTDSGRGSLSGISGASVIGSRILAGVSTALSGISEAGISEPMAPGGSENLLGTVPRSDSTT